MLFLRIQSFFMTISLFFSLLFSGNIYHYTNNYIFYNYYYGNQERQCLDLVIPKTANGETGLVLFIHGGGYTAGSKDEYKTLLFDGANMYNCAIAAINYRYVSKNTGFDEILEDIDSALTSIKELASSKGVNITKMVLNGTSAGGHLSLLYAYKCKNTSPIKPVGVVSFCGVTDLSDSGFWNENMLWNMGDEGFSYMNELFSRCVKATVNESTLATVTPKLLEYSPVNYVDANTVPTIMYHGQQDIIVPYSNAVTLAQKLETAGVEYKLASNPNVGHNIFADTAFGNQGYDDICLMVEKYLPNYKK